MNQNVKRILSQLLVVAMLISVLPTMAFATEWSENNVVFDGTSFGTNGYYNVISQKEYTLVPGAATETEMVLNNAAGNRRQVLHIIEVDPSNPDVSILPGYYGIDKDLTDIANQSAAGVTDVANYYANTLHYNVVAAMNTDLYYEANAPRVLIYNGQDLRSGRKTNSVLCVYEDTNGKVSCDIKPYVAAEITDELANGNADHGALIHAVSVSFGMTVRDGELVSKTEERTSSTAARSMVGIKEDGTLVLVMNDGRGANNSVGFNDYELGESMLALGCKWAANCDGGGSSCIVTKRAGEDVTTMRCVPCDGAERPTIHSVLVVSNVGPTGELNNVNITADYDIFAPGTTYTFGADAIDTHGYAMDMPADATWTLSDESFGAIENGTFVSNGTTGDVDIQVISGGNVVGAKTVTVANPETLAFAATETTLPYGKFTELEFVSKTGEAQVYLDGSSFTFELSNPAAGTLDGLTFTATTDENAAGTTITATYVPTGAELNFTVNLGKGSEVLWDFEDGDISAWASTEEADQFMRDGGAPLNTVGTWSTPFRTMHNGGQISWSNTTSTALSSVADGGKAHGGDKALAVTFNMKNVEFNSWVYAIIYNIQGNTVLRDVENGKAATKFGCWVYIPKGFYTAKNNGALSLQLQSLKSTSSTGALSGNQLNLQYNGKNINALKESDIPENRWVYVTADLTANNFVKLSDPLDDIYRSPSIMRMYVKPSEAQELTYYFDDFTLDYSSAVDDRNPPIISAPTYCTNDTNIDLDGQTINTNVVSFNATVAEYAASNASGLDYSSAAIYIDGVKYAANASGSGMSLENVTLSNGAHSIKFEIADRQGNPTTLTKTLVVDAAAAKSAVRLSGHNDLDNTIEAGSVYYVDVVADAIEDIDTVTATIELHSAHEWELDHMILAKGFEGSYTLNSIKDNVATVTITKTGATNLTGEQIIASLPARVWSFDESTWVGGDSTAAPQHMTASQRYATSYGEPVLFVEAAIEKGEIEYADGTDGSFYSAISETTAVTGNKLSPWHEHTEVAMEDKAATCTEEGYSGRTYCYECGSVVDWGVTLPKVAHDYQFVDNILTCTTCGELFNGTYEDGQFYVDGVASEGWIDNTYYVVNGHKVTGAYLIGGVVYTFDANGVYQPNEEYNGLYEDGANGWMYVQNNVPQKDAWFNLEDGWHYFTSHGYAAVGTMTMGGRDYRFEGEQGKCIGAWVETASGNRFYFNYTYYRNTWAEIEGEQYYFDGSGYCCTGICAPTFRSAYLGAWEFDADGKLVGTVTGVFYDAKTNAYLYAIDGEVQYGLALTKVGDDYYYVRTNGLLVTDRMWYVDKDNAYGFPQGNYTFGADGKMVVVSGGEEEGVIIETESGLIYVIDGVQQFGLGLTQIGNDFYYVRSTGKLVVDQTWYVGKDNAYGFPHGDYSFGADGKMQLLNGIIEENGDLVYYIDGIPQSGLGLTEIDGDYYYVRSTGKLVVNRSWYVDKNNAYGFPYGDYSFGADGKMQLLNGIVEDNGALIYYIDGIPQSALGLTEIDGDYYYVRSNGKLVVNQTWYVDKGNAYGFPYGDYSFGADGRMQLLNGIIEENGALIYYIDGIPQSGLGLTEIDGDYYYVRSNGKLVVNQTWYVDKNNAYGFPYGDYSFGADGRMQLLNGIIEENGALIYYIDGIPQSGLGLTEIDGDYYYVRSNGKLVVNQTWYVGKDNAYGFPYGDYSFGADGRMLIEA